MPLRWIWLCIAVLCASAPARASPAQSVIPPAVQNQVEIDYPAALAEQDDPPRGTVVVKFTVGTDGIPHTIEADKSVHPDLDALAIDAVSRLRYTPATIDGTPVEVILRLSIPLAPATKREPEPELEPKPEPEPDPDKPLRLSGQILEAGYRTPVEGASITVLPAPADAKVGQVKKKSYAEQRTPAWSVSATSDAKGKFAARGTGDGKIRVIVLAAGYERAEFIESLPANQSIAVRYYLQRLSDNPYRTVVRTRLAEREEVSRHTIEVQEIDNLPGTQGDALKAIQNFPGIARAPFGIGLLVIRGADPTDSAVYLGEHEIPQLFHFGGITSVFNSDVLTEIDYIPGNFDARYGDATGGVIDVKTRPGRRDGYHGYIDSDLFDTGVLFEGPIGKGSFVLSGRRSYIDLLLPVFLPDDAGIDLVLAPRYYDYQALFDYPVSKGTISAKVFGSDDRTRLVAADPNEVDTDERDQFETTLLFHRFDLLYQNHRDRWDFLITPSYRYDSFSAGAGDLFRFTVRSHTFSARAEVGRRVSRRLRWDVGMQLFTGAFTIDAEAPPVPMQGAGFPDTRFETKSRNVFAAPALYGTLSVGVGERVTLYPGVRLGYYGVLFERAAFDPRLRFRIDVAERTAVKGGVGLYSQIPDAPQWNQTFGNPRVGTEHAVHTSLAVSREFDPAIKIEVAGFYKYLYNLATPSSEVVVRPNGIVGPEAFASHGAGRIYGGEIFVRKELTRSFFGWVSYTVSRSERQASPADDFVLFDLDQTHILTLIGVYRLPKNWQVGARFRVVSGNPFTPISGAVLDSGAGDYIPIFSPINSDRVPVFHQLDLRVDKRFVWRRVMLTTYLDVQNVYNRQNPEFINYSFDFSQTSFITSLPIIPSLGLKLEF